MLDPSTNAGIPLASEHSAGYVGAYFVAVFCSRYDFHGFVRELRLLLYDEQEVVFLAFLHQDVAVGK